MSESEDESDLDFSPSEDEYIPTGGDSDCDDEDETCEDETQSEEITPKLKKFVSKKNVYKGRNESDDSDSSVENYLVDPNKIDLGSEFFTSKFNTVPTFDCNVGLNMSDSDNDVFDEVPSTSRGQQLDFNMHVNFNQKLENDKEQLRNYKSTKIDEDNCENDVSKLLAIGEVSTVPTSSLSAKQTKDLNVSDGSDWEEVEGDLKNERKKDVEVRIGPIIKKKPNKYQAEIEASIKRKINRRKKENQLLMHKVHLLSWIGYGNFINKVLNSTKLMEMVVKFIPSSKCYPKDRTDKKYFEQIIKWYKTVIGLKSKEQNCKLTCLPPIATSLALQIQTKMAICKKDYVFIFVILLRSMGIQCRLVINLATIPIRPPAKELCVISTKKTDEKKPASDAMVATNVKSLQVETKTKVEKRIKRGESGKEKVTASQSKPENKPNSVSGEIPRKRAKVETKSEKASNEKKSLKIKLDEAVKSTDKNRSEAKSDCNNKIFKRRSLSLQVISSNDTNIKRSKIASSNESKPSPNISKIAKNANAVNLPISQRTRLKVSRVTRSNVRNNESIISSIPQLDGGHDVKTSKKKPQLVKLKFPLRSASVPISPTQTASVSSSRSAPKLRSRNQSPSPARSTKSGSKIESDGKNANKIKPQLTKITSRLESISKSSSSSISKRASPISTLASTQVSNISGKFSKKPRTIRPTSSSNTSILPTKIAAKSSAKVTFASSTASSPTKTGVSPSNKKVVLTRNSNLRAKLMINAKGTSSNTETTLKLSKSKKALNESSQKHKIVGEASSDSDFAPSPIKKVNTSPSVTKPLPKAVEQLKKRIDRRVLSTDDESTEPQVRKNEMNYWIEVYCEAEHKWMCVDLFKLKVHYTDDIKKRATKPIAYVFAWNNNNSIKDVSPRYCSQWNTTTRKSRVDVEWLDETLLSSKEPLSQRCAAEDRELEEIHSKTPMPTSISEFKNHPLYVLKRHLLKFEAIYPPNAVSLAFIRDEPIYARCCVHTLHSREIWVKQARVVKPGETAYKIVKARPKWDRLANKMLESQPLEIFGYWQTQPYEPPTAENGIVPRNAYGNVELFKPEMLPKNTVHLQLPGLNRVCHKLKIDCAQAVVGFDFHGGSSHPTFDGFVVCKEFAELVTMQWWEDQEEAERKSKEKQNKRVYDNWKKLIKGLLIRQRLQRKYNFAGKNTSASSSPSSKK